ncbi:MAG: FecR domain-containing protein [Pseudomonadota bacterium]|nr:FecR domain-containing protein [Pseudomonadota bacterium]
MSWLLPVLLATAAWGVSAAALPSASDPAADVYLYDVVEGDTLIGIAELLLDDPADWRQIRTLNAVAKPRRLRPGSRLRLPLTLMRRREMSAEVAFMQGQVSAQSGTAAARDLQPGDLVRRGDLLRTGAASSLTLALHDGSRIVIWASSRVRIAELLALGRAGIPLVRLEVEQGDAEMRVAPAAPLRRFEVDTPAINLGVRGTQFRTRVDAAGTSRVEVLKGRVQGWVDRQTVPIDAGLGLVAIPGQALSAPQPLPGAPHMAGVTTRFEALPLTLAWPAQGDATGYRVQVGEPIGAAGGALIATEAATAQAGAAVRFDGDTTQPTLRLADLPDGRWQLRVRAINALALQGPESTVDFVVKARPEPPFTRTPEPAAQLHGAQVAFSWARNTAAHSVRLQVTQRAGPDARAFEAPLLLDQTAVPGTGFSGELAPGEYRWRLRSVAAGADGMDDPGPWGEAQSFSLRLVPQSPALEAPAFSDDGSVQLRWRAPPPGEEVRVQVARDNGFAAPVLEQSGALDRVRLADPEPGSYFLRIRSVGDDGFVGPWSAPQQFEVPRSKGWYALPVLFLLLFTL